MTLNERVLTLKQKLARKRGCKLLPPMDSEALRSMEEQYGFTLPEDFRLFLTLAGNGGTLPPITGDCDQLLPFPQEPGELERLGRPFAEEDTLVWVQSPDPEPQMEAAYNGNGFVTLMEDECCGNDTYLLVVTGPCRGEVWYRAEPGIVRLKNCSFLDWLELHLSKKLQKFIREQLKANQSATEKMDLILAVREKVEQRRKRGANWNPPISLNEVQDFERRHGITLPKEYVQFITQIANGIESDTWVIYPLQTFDDMPGLAEPFPFQTEEDFAKTPMKEHYNPINPSFWDSWGKYFPDITIPDQVHKTWLKEEYSVLRGALPVAAHIEPPNTPKKFLGQTILVLNGAFRGQMWSINFQFYIPNQFSNFLPYIRDTLV